MSANYDSIYYYSNPEMQLTINLEKIKDELIALVETIDCNKCKKMKCECLGVGVMSADTRQHNTPSISNVKFKNPSKDWSFKFTSLNIDDDKDVWNKGKINDGSLKLKPLEERRLTSETVEEFFQNVRKKQIAKCS